MGRTIRMICGLMVAVIMILPCAGLADGAYEMLKTMLSTKLVSDVDVPTYVNAGMSVPETEGMTTCIISLNDGYIGISGRNQSNKYEGRLYNNLSSKQLYLYAISICTMYESIDNAKTTATSFLFGIDYGSGEDDIIVIPNAEIAEKASELLTKMAGDIK